MKLERLPRYGCGQEIRMLKRRRYVDDGDLCPPYQFPEKVLPYVNVLRVGVGDRLLRELHCTLITLEHPYATRMRHQGT